MQDNDNFFISSELLDVFDEESLIDKKDLEDIVYQLKIDSLTYKCNITKIKFLKDYNRITFKTRFNILSSLFLKKDISFIVKNKNDVIKKVNIDLNSEGLRIKRNKDNIYIIKLNLEKTSHGI